MNYRKRSIGFIFLVVSAAAFAAYEYKDYLAALCTRESGCNPSSQNQSGYLGNYQMGEAALIDAGYYNKDNTPDTNDWKGSWTGKNGINSKADFFASAEKQAQAINDYNDKQWSYIKADGSDQYLGQTINGILITESGLLAGAHLVGHGGLHKFLASNGQVVPQDGNKIAVTHYIGKFSGYNIAQISGNVTTGGNTGGNAVVNTADAGANPDHLNYISDTGHSTGGFEGTAVAPSVAFKSGSGLSFDDVNLAIQSIIAMILLLWTAYVSWGQFRLWSEGLISIMIMQSNIIKATTIMMFLLFIVLT